MSIFNEMIKNDYEMDQKFFHVIIKGFLKHKEFDMAYRVF